MTYTPLANPVARPNREHPQVCRACAEGDHERPLLDEHCPCPCHGVRNSASEVSG
jgi:hypothetical protein